MTETRYIEGQSRYALSEMVGRGGFATVWRARPVGGGSYFGGGPEDVAIKIIPVYNQGERSRALREGQIAEHLRHPNIVETLEIIAGESEVYLVTEFVQGLPLDEAARYYDCAEISHSLAQILEALVYAHAQGIIHRDIKPQNALVDRQGAVKLTDFGVAFRAGDTRLTRIGFAVGTPGYIAPEIMDGADPTALTDIYAVGATARTLLSHQPEETPPLLKEFVDAATAPNPAHRPQSAWAALKVLTGKKNPTKRRERPPESRTQLKRPTPRPPERREDYEPYREDSGSRAVKKRPSERLIGGLLRTANGAAAAFLGFMLAIGILRLGGAEAAGIAAGFAVAGYLLPRIASLTIVAAVAVAALSQGAVASSGVAIIGAAIGILWIGASGASLKGAAKLPLGPVLSVPLAAINLAAGLPFLFGALMRPVAAGITAGLAGTVLLLNDIVRSDGMLPFYDVAFRTVPAGSGPGPVVDQLLRIVTQEPWIVLIPALWAAMAVLVSVGEWIGRPFWGFFLSVGVGVLGYAIVIPGIIQTVNVPSVMTSLGLASIMYAALRYVVAKSSR